MFDITTKTENAMRNLAQSNSFETTVIGGFNRKMSSHAYSFRSTPTVPAAMIPCNILTSGEIKVGILGSLTTHQYMVLKKKYSVRIDRLKDLGKYYKSYNHLYENVEIDVLSSELLDNVPFITHYRRIHSRFKKDDNFSQAICDRRTYT